MRNVRQTKAVELLETLEPRLLMSGLSGLRAALAMPRLVVGDDSSTLLATLPGKNVVIAEDGTSEPTLEVTVNWGDGSSSAATLHRAGGKIQVWGGHAYNAVKHYGVSLAATTDGSSKLILRRSVNGATERGSREDLETGGGAEFFGGRSARWTARQDCRR